jgi:predicted RNase H-like nuclease (RuvC/YqgF family)
MKKITIFLLAGLLSSSLNCENPEIAPQELQEEKNDQRITTIKQAMVDSRQNFVDPLNSRGNHHPILDGIEREIPEGMFKRYIVLLILNPARKMQEELKKLTETIICYHDSNDQKIAKLEYTVEELQKKDQEKQKAIEELKQQVKYMGQLKIREASRDITGG